VSPFLLPSVSPLGLQAAEHLLKERGTLSSAAVPVAPTPGGSRTAQWPPAHRHTGTQAQ